MDNTRSTIANIDSLVPQESEKEVCVQLISDSNVLYRHMLMMLKSLSANAEAATPQQLEERQLKFNELQRQIEVNDQRINLALTTIAHPDEVMKKLLEDKRHILEELLGENRKVTMQAQAIRSVIADEIRKTTTGHAALKGYRTTDHQQNSGSFRKSM